MALIGTMKYLTIGNNTYEIEGGELPIASASTLGGIKVGSGLTIDDSTGVLTASDTKVTQTYATASGYTYWRPLVVGYSSASAESGNPSTVTNTTYTFNTIKVQPSTGTIRFGAAALYNGSYTTTISANTLTAARTLTAPDKSGTIALTSDIPSLTGYATTTYVDDAIAALPEPMLFKGSVGTGGTITSLPTAAAANEGFTYKVITALSTPVTAKVGDTVISTGSEWVVIPSGDEPSGTVTSVAVSNNTNGGLTISGSPITSSGTITIGHSNVLTNAQTTQAVYPIKIDKNGHISEYGNAVSIPTKTSDLTNDSGFISSYTETDPIFGASAAAGITSTDISNWNAKSDTDEKLKWTASTSSNTYYPLQSTSTATTSTANTLNGINFYQYYNTAGGYRRLNLGNATAWKSSGGAYGTIRLYGAAATYYGDLVPGVLGTTSGDGHISANRTWTLPDKTGTIALTSDLPTIPTNVSAFTNDAGYLTSYTETDPTVPSWAKAASKPTYTASEVGALASNTTYVSTITTTAGTHSAITSKSGTVSFNVPTHTSHLTNDSGFITSYTDEKVKSTPATVATTYYLIGSTSSSENTATASKHASLVAYTTANSGTSGYTELRLGNTTATSSAGGKEGTIRLYGTNATYYTTLKAGAVASSNKTITFPNATGTVALISDIPTVPTNVSAFTNDAGYITGYTETDPTVPSWAKASSKPTYTASEVGALPSSTTYVSKITTTAGAHTAISNQSGAVSFNVPTKTSHLTNDSGYINSSTATPTANTVAKFDSSAHMNSGDMSAQDVSNFVSALDTQGTNLTDYVVGTGVDGIWTYRKWASGLYDAWYEGAINLLAGTAWGTGGFYYHASSSTLTPPSFSQSVTSLTGGTITARLAIYCGAAANYQQYWMNATGVADTITVRLDMHGTWQ